MPTSVPIALLLLFFKDATAALLHLNGSEAKEALKDNPFDSLVASRKHVLEVQQTVLQKSLETYQNDHDNDEMAITMAQLRETLGGLGRDPDLSQDLRDAMEAMNEAAKLALCKLVLYLEYFVATTSPNSRSMRELQDSVATQEGLDRTRLLEYFGLCQTALKLHNVKKFMAEGGSLFEGLSTSCTNLMDSSPLLFPQTRLEFVQQLLAKSLGWDPVFLTKELQRIFVERNDSIVLVHDKQVNEVFQDLIQDMQVSIRTASLLMKQDQELKMMSDIEKGGNTRVVSVQYSEFDVAPDGKKVAVAGNSAPGASTMEAQMSEEEQKKQIRLASEAAVLQQEILGELLSLPEHERNNKLEEAEQISQDFMEQVMKLPPGPQRIDMLRSVDPDTSRKLAMHKLWKGLLEANGGKPPKLATNGNH